MRSGAARRPPGVPAPPARIAGRVTQDEGTLVTAVLPAAAVGTHVLALNPLDSTSLLTSLGTLGVFLVLFAETGLLIGFFLPGDSLLFTAGLLCTTAAASKIHLALPAALLAAAPAALLGAQTGYWIGPRAGRPPLWTPPHPPPPPPRPPAPGAPSPYRARHPI